MGIKGKRKKMRLRLEKLENDKRAEEAQEQEIKMKQNEIHALIDMEAMSKHRIDEADRPKVHQKSKAPVKGKMKSMQIKLSKEKSQRKKRFYNSSWSTR